MADSGGGLAIGILIILAFAGFVLWAKTPQGKRILEESLGAPDRRSKKSLSSCRRSALPRAKSPASRTAASKSSRPKSAAAKTPLKKPKAPVRKSRP